MTDHFSNSPTTDYFKAIYSRYKTAETANKKAIRDAFCPASIDCPISGQIRGRQCLTQTQLS
ncbi:MAG: hypothetical protein AAB035_01885 [Nitrospirota bacterium]